MKKTLLRIGSACGFAILIFGSSNAYAFCTEYYAGGAIPVNCLDEGHVRVTSILKPILRSGVWQGVWDGNFSQDDLGSTAAGLGERHFESCRFATDDNDVKGSTGYIRQTYLDTIAELNPLNPKPFAAAKNFGKLLHTVQDFYSHTNWVNLLDITAPSPVDPSHLIDRTTAEWRLLDPLTSVRDDIIVGQIPTTGLPGGWQVEQEMTSETPFFTTDGGSIHPGLITGWNSSGACPDVRAGMVIDEWSHTVSDGMGHIDSLPRNTRMVHGESRIAGLYDLGDAYQETRPCHKDYPTHVCLQKDHTDRPDYGQVIALSEYQTSHEWCRLLHLTKESQFGYSAASILMTLWADPDEPFGPHPASTACETPPEVLNDKPGPIELTVNPHISVNYLPEPDGPPGSRNLTFALYTGDFRRSQYNTYTQLSDETRVRAEPMTMCVKPDDTLVAAVSGWDDFNDEVENPSLDKNDRVIRGVTWILDGPNFQPREDNDEDYDMELDIEVEIGGHDPDGDGLSSACGETFYGTDPFNSDTDDDGLTDGAEVNTHGTDPLDSDTDDDGLSDSAEVNTYGTDPLDSDTDDDGLSDSQELDVGTNPLNPDTDGDGLLDGQDVDWIEDAILAIPEDAIQSSGKKGNRNAMLNLLADAESHLRRGRIKPALDKLTTLRSRIVGCGSGSDSNDWITDCAEQVRIRQLLDILIANV
jgi:hypothetical protein